jgi:NadR type nicotinamide-nucleotide adenylyltransferase
MRQWRHLPRCVRPHFVRRVSILGPESTGKTTLAASLASTLDTVWVPEWARAVLERRGGALDGLDWMELIDGQIASEEALAREANRVLLCDTDPLATTIWADALLGECPSALYERARGRRYDLTLLPDPDVPWVADSVRYLPHGGRDFFAKCEAALAREGRPYRVLRGTWAERTDAALDAIGALLR